MEFSWEKNQFAGGFSEGLANDFFSFFFGDGFF